MFGQKVHQWRVLLSKKIKYKYQQTRTTRTINNNNNNNHTNQKEKIVPYICKIKKIKKTQHKTQNIKYETKQNPYTNDMTLEILLNNKSRNISDQSLLNKNSKTTTTTTTE